MIGILNPRKQSSNHGSQPFSIFSRLPTPFHPSTIYPSDVIRYSNIHPTIPPPPSIPPIFDIVVDVPMQVQQSEALFSNSSESISRKTAISPEQSRRLDASARRLPLTETSRASDIQAKTEKKRRQKRKENLDVEQKTNTNTKCLCADAPHTQAYKQVSKQA
ncbi:hypothetical protein BKA81DRAFT_356961 [Phyllosticta paracitricarpa]